MLLISMLLLIKQTLLCNGYTVQRFWRVIIQHIIILLVGYICCNETATPQDLLKRSFYLALQGKPGFHSFTSSLEENLLSFNLFFSVEERHDRTESDLVNKFSKVTTKVSKSFHKVFFFHKFIFLNFLSYSGQ